MKSCPYHDYYVNQAGSGVGAIYRGNAYQKGHGFGSFLKGLLRSVMPFVKSGLKTVGKEAIRSGTYFINDVVNDTPIKEALNSRLNESVNNLKRQAKTKIDSMMGSGLLIKRQRLANKIHNSSARHRLKTSKIKSRRAQSPDIFDKK